MPKLDKIEYEKRIRIVQEWILEDWPYGDIVQQIILKWGIEERQAKRYVAEARKRWVNDESILIGNKRKLKILSLKKLKRSLRESYKGTPEGIRAIMAIEKEIITLEGIRPAEKHEIGGLNGQPLPTPQIIINQVVGESLEIKENED